MKQPKYTPGWVANALTEASANARLNAAAPDLLAALTEIDTDPQLYSALAHVYGDTRAAALCGQIRAAIRKATETKEK